MLGSGLSILRRGGLCLYFVLCVSLLLPQTISYCSFPSRGSPILFQASWRSIEPHRSTGSPSAYARDATSASTVALNETSSIEAAELVLERVQYTRSSLVKLIEESWKKVSRLVPASTLQLCETELNGAISLLVLATIRRSAEEFSSSRSLIEEMLREADSNHDGQLSYSEWYQWLRSGGSDDGGGGSLFAEMSMSSTTDTPADASLLGGRAGEDGGGESSSEQADPAYAGAPAAASVRLSIQPFSLSEQHATSAAQGTDPMVPALGLVLGHAVCTLKTVARMSQDPAVLSASFVAGGMAAGVLDESVCRRMLARLSPYARELVVHALSLESSSLTASSRESLGSCTAWLAPPTMRQARTAPAVPLRIGAVRPSGEGGGPPRPSASGRAFPVLAVDGGGGGDEYFTVAGTRDASRQADGSPLGGRQRLAAAGSGRGVGLGGVAQQGTTAPIKFGRRRQGSDGPAALGKARGPAGGTRAAAKTKAAGVDDDSIIMTVDLSSIPLLAAPSISDPVPDGAASIVGEGEDAMMDDSDPYDSEQSLTLRGESTVSAQGTITRDEGTVDFSEGAAGGLYSFGGTSSSAPEALGGAPLGAMQLYAQSKAVGASTEVLGGLLDRMAGIMQGAVELRDGLQDLDDAQAGQMRMLLLGNSHQRLDVLGLSMALRGARLQHANRQPMHIRHQLALETLQLWAPLSFQVSAVCDAATCLLAGGC
ncbi:hypothetical protein B484DRAFT_163540 [Ochromonadaceae sp. CCMP2298]|nr:hypothetical protein B484DRAFT_163540 [Ochromonadaceae sp. CCMP2298]